MPPGREERLRSLPIRPSTSRTGRETSGRGSPRGGKFRHPRSATPTCLGCRTSRQSSASRPIAGVVHGQWWHVVEVEAVKRHPQGGMVEAEAVDGRDLPPTQLFLLAPRPACVWNLAKEKSNGVAERYAKLRDRRGEGACSFDARKMGTVGVGLAQAEGTCRRTRSSASPPSTIAWRGRAGRQAPLVTSWVFCKAASLQDIAKHNIVLTYRAAMSAPGRPREDAEPFEEKFDRLTAEVRTQFAEGRRLGRRRSRPQPPSPPPLGKPPLLSL